MDSDAWLLPLGFIASIVVTLCGQGFKVVLGIVAALAGTNLYLRWTKGIYNGTNRMDGKTVIVTGGNAGIGKETAKELARRGARVILACRSTAKGQRAADEILVETGCSVVVRQLDLCSLKSVRQFADDIARSEERLDVLVNNAGIFPDRMQLTDDGFEECFQANYLGHFLLTLLLTGMLKKCAPSRVVNLTSGLHHLGHTQRLEERARGTHPWVTPTLAYSDSKMAVVCFTRTLARKLKTHGVTVNAVHPGIVKTTIADRESLMSLFLRFLYNTVGKTPWEGAQTVVYAAVDDRFVESSGKYLVDCTDDWVNWRALDKREARRAFETSVRLVGMELDHVQKLL
ncbi:retinol dehydrogenase 12-like [Dermacentor silvarum]|uniref:retinol dehydrogenase 12-like n=1 Tax=Dermacentor silvarum TaxID=543639 RepID=UPI00189B0BAA|nr:retinol dehydrogenase 12-like [Dermacentor silvarum]